MADKRKRGQNFTSDDKIKLINLLRQYKDTILNKKTDGTTNEAKALAWANLTVKFNSTSTNHRTKDSLLRLWEKLKTEAKLYAGENKHNNSGTGGGPCRSNYDPTLEQVCAILGRGCTGIEGVNDCDAENIPVSIPPTNFSQPIIDQVEPTIIREAPLIIVNESTSDTEHNISLSQSQPVLTLRQQAPPLETEQDINTLQTPVWARRCRPQLSNRSDERSEAVATVSSSFVKVNKKRLGLEDLKIQLIEEEIAFKRKLYALQLEAAAKDVEIKNELLKQIKGGELTLSSLLQNKE